MVFHQYETGVRSGTIKPAVTLYEINQHLSVPKSPLTRPTGVSAEKGVKQTLTVFCVMSEIVSWHDQRPGLLSQKWDVKYHVFLVDSINGLWGICGVLKSLWWNQLCRPFFSIRARCYYFHTGFVPQRDISHLHKVSCLQHHEETLHHLAICIVYGLSLSDSKENCRKEKILRILSA